jgi:hypothetical protein
MAKENPLWSRRRIAMELAKLGHAVDNSASVTAGRTRASSAIWSGGWSSSSTGKEFDANRSDPLAPDVGIPLQVVTEAGAEPGDDRTHRYTKSAARTVLKAGHGALGVLDLAHDPRAVIEVGSPLVREAQFAGGSLKTPRVQSRLELGHFTADGGLGDAELSEATGLHDPGEHEDFVEVHN